MENLLAFEPEVLTDKLGQIIVYTGLAINPSGNKNDELVAYDKDWAERNPDKIRLRQ